MNGWQFQPMDAAACIAFLQVPWDSKNRAHQWSSSHYSLRSIDIEIYVCHGQIQMQWHDKNMLILGATWGFDLCLIKVSDMYLISTKEE